MESKKINQLATELAPALSDLTIIGDPTTGISKKITLSQMASLFTGTVEEYASVSAFPLVGAADTIYIALDTNVLYRWDIGLTSYVELSPNIINSLVFNDANGFDGTISLVGSVATLTITTALTTGSVGFIGASGALSQDNANYFWDNTNKRLGINTNAPTTALDVFGSGIIGRLNGTSTNNAFLGFASAGTNKWSIGNVQSDHRFRIYSEANTAELVSVLQTGEFGIGIANPTTKLHIDGGASALIANLDANVSVAKSISFRSDNSNRFNIEVSGTESGSNAGANFFIRRYSDAGALIDTPLTITRSTGAATFANSVSAKSLSVNETSINTYGILSLYGSSRGGQIDFYDTSTIGASIYGGTSSDKSLYFTTNGNSSIRLTIASTGNIGMGTSTPNFGGYTSGTTVLSIAASATDKFGVLELVGNRGVGENQNGQIIFANNNGGTTNVTARITGLNGASNVADGILTFETRPSAGVLTERMRIFNSGEIGIGMTTSTYGKISVKSNTTTSYGGFNIYANGNGNFTFMNHDNNVGWIGTEFGAGGTGQTPLAFNVGGTERIRITTAGAVLIGRTAPFTFFGDSNGIVQYGDGTIYCSASNNESLGLARIGTDGNVAIFRRSTTTVGSISVTGSATAFNTSSDYRLKEDLKDFDALNIMSKIKFYDFAWKTDNSRTTGVIAHELQEIVPYAVYGNKDAEEMQGVDYSKLVAIQGKAIQQLKAEIEILKAK